MNTIIVLSIVFVATAMLVFVAKYESRARDRNTNIFYYSIGVKVIMTIAVLFMPLGYIADYFRGFKAEIHVIVAYVVLGIIFVLSWLYFLKGKVILTDNFIEKITPFWHTRIPYDEIKKIVIHRSIGNPGAAMTRVYGNKKITLESFLIGYEELLNELQYRCKHSEIIEK